MSAALEIAGFLLCLGGWTLIGATLPHNYWKISSIHGSVITTSTLFENLWKSCAEDSTGVSNCREFDSMFALPDVGARPRPGGTSGRAPGSCRQQHGGRGRENKGRQQVR
uniref:Claudin n=1 Tax=Apteryx owenii TaxID=8824 RepID=A0A8B9PWZ2_APTOW